MSDGIGHAQAKSPQVIGDPYIEGGILVSCEALEAQPDSGLGLFGGGRRDAAKALLEANPGAPVPMVQVAAHAGVSRQALYLHFTDRTTLFVEVSRVVDASLRTAARQRRVDDAPTARAALREAVALQAWLKPRLKGVATALDVLRRHDPAADAAWKEREHARLQHCEHVVRRLQAEGDLAPGWEVSTAARCFWAVTSQRVWDDLAMDQGWSTAQYRNI